MTFRINVQTLEVKKLGKNGNVPDKILGAGLAFYMGSLYFYGYYWPDRPNNINEQSLYRYDIALQTWGIVEVIGEKPEKRVFHSTFVYNDEMFIVYGLYISTSIIYDSIWKFVFSSSTWELISNIAGDGVVNTGNPQNESIVYILYGRNSINIFNAVFYFDLSEPVPTRKYLSNNWDSPSKRKNHCSMVINDHIFIFGGVSDSVTHLNDMWYFDITNNYWIYISVTGAIPSARQLAACGSFQGNSILLFGGTNQIVNFNDLYYFDAYLYQWKEITPIMSPSPTPRFSACLAIYQTNLLILGGRDDTSIFDEIWVYNYLNNKYMLSNADDPLKIPATNYKCWIDSELEVIYVISGVLLNLKPVNTIYKIQIIQVYDSIKTMTSLVYETSIPLLSQNSLIISGDYAYLIFGTYWEYVTIPSIIEINYKTGAEVVWNFDADFTFYGHIAGHYKDSIYIFGGGSSSGGIIIGNSANNGLYKITKSNTMLSRLECSSGTIGNECTPCQSGYYEKDSKCVPCPAGRYSTTIASTGVYQCFPCNFGQFNNKLGNTYCYDCLPQDYCPILSVSPGKRTEVPLYESTQPLAYKSDTNSIEKLVSQFWYGLGGLIVIITLFGIAHQNLWEKIRKIDCFITQHPQELLIPVIYKKTHIGGIFTIFFILAAGITIIGSIMTFYLDNVTEIKSLVPVIILSDEIDAETLVITISLYSYGGDCIENSECSPSQNFVYSGFNYTSNSTVCVQEGTTCTIIISYYKYSISSTSSLNLQFRDPSASASLITINVTSSSSIPGEKSGIFLPIFTNSDYEIFLGTSPTIVTFELTPSVLIS